MKNLQSRLDNKTIDLYNVVFGLLLFEEQKAKKKNKTKRYKYVIFSTRTKSSEQSMSTQIVNYTRAVQFHFIFSFRLFASGQPVLEHCGLNLRFIFVIIK